MMSKSRITIDRDEVGEPRDWLHNPHAGEMLWSEFMDPLDLSVSALADLVCVDAARLSEVVEGRRRMDADLDLRLTRYFRMSPGFFLGLQTEYELLEARRALNGELERIMPRAA